MATLVEKAFVVFLPLAALLYPLLKLLPQMYDWIMQLWIRRLYAEMRAIERERETQGPGYDANVIKAKFEQLNQRANQLKMSSAYASNLYTLRDHIGLVRDQMAASAAREKH
jgi:hypothetical protein